MTSSHEVGRTLLAGVVPAGQLRRRNKEVQVKKFAVIMSVSLLASGAFAAGTIRDNCGCGLGTMAFGDNPPTLISELGATFLNGLFGTQTFGITSGTSECERPANFASNARIQQYVADNLDQLATDIAVGQGESLDALADLMSIQSKDRTALYTSLQSNFDNIFTTSTVSSQDVVKNLDKVING